MLRNLVEHKVVVGVVERMEQSLALIRHVLDDDDGGGGGGDGHIGALGDTSGQANNSKGGLPKQRNDIVLNKSKRHSTDDIVAELEKDDEFVVLLRQFLRYDADVYDFALKLHERQHEWLEALKRGQKE